MYLRFLRIHGTDRKRSTKTFLDGFYATFKNIAPVRVLLKIAKPEVLPPGLPANVMTQSWFSQIQVLSMLTLKFFTRKINNNNNNLNYFFVKNTKI